LVHELELQWSPLSLVLNHPELSNGFCVKSFRQSLLTTKRGKWIHHLLKSSKRSCHTKTGIDQHQIKNN
jgi:hypothetical protein